jgi:hypothetical protein
LILTNMPDLPPRPETPANASFRRDFYRRWGREWCVVAGSARHELRSRVRQVADSAQAERLELVAQHRANAPQIAHRQRCQELTLGARGHDAQAVRLAQAARDLGD